MGGDELRRIGRDHAVFHLQRLDEDGVGDSPARAGIRQLDLVAGAGRQVEHAERHPDAALICWL